MKREGSKPFVDALRGIGVTFANERNFKMHVFLAVMALLIGLFLQLSVFEWMWITLSISLVFIAELLNTAIEAAVDLASPRLHPLAKKAKDAAAGGVLIAAIFALAIGMVIFLPKLWLFFRNSFFAN